MPTTTQWNIRYPSLTDSANVPQDMKNMADDIEGVFTTHGLKGDTGATGPTGPMGPGRPAVVTTLPVSPSDSDEIYLNAGPDNGGRLWHCRYTTGTLVPGGGQPGTPFNPGPRRWQVLGGAPLLSKVIWQSTGVSAAHNTFTDISTTPATDNLHLTVPFTGHYMLRWGVYIDQQTFQQTAAVGDSPLTTTYETELVGANTSKACGRSTLLTDLSAGKVLSLYIQQTSGITQMLTAEAPFLELTPIAF